MLKVHTTRSGNVSVICVQGRIVRGEIEALRSAVLAASNASALVLDLGRVSLIDAGGLGVMLELRAHIESQGIEFRLRNVTKLVRQVLEITRLDSVFENWGDSELRQIPFPGRPATTMRAAACA